MGREDVRSGREGRGEREELESATERHHRRERRSRKEARAEEKPTGGARRTRAAPRAPGRAEAEMRWSRERVCGARDAGGAQHAARRPADPAGSGPDGRRLGAARLCGARARQPSGVARSGARGVGELVLLPLTLRCSFSVPLFQTVTVGRAVTVALR